MASIVHYEFLAVTQTIIAAVYCDQLRSVYNAPLKKKKKTSQCSSYRIVCNSTSLCKQNCEKFWSQMLHTPVTEPETFI